MALPDCPACSAASTLQKVGAEVQGHVWAVCSCCSKPALVRLSDGVIVRRGKP